MKSRPITDLIQIDTSLTTPVYKQIVQSIYRNIDKGILNKDDMLPSVNQISAEFSLARGSVFSAYNDLRSSGIIDSIPGKGYFIVSTRSTQKINIFLLFSTFTPYKETLFNALLQNLPKSCSMDIYFHHHSMKMFENIIKEQAAYYNRFVIMPEVHELTPGILSRLDPKHTFLLDVGYKDYQKTYPGVYQNFEKDIYSILIRSEQLIAKYKKLVLVFPESLRTRDIIAGFNKFSRRKIIPTQVVATVNAEAMEPGDAFIVIDDQHLVDVIGVAKAKKWKLGQDIGIMSYNETTLKSVIGEGITTITTDFVAMGKAMAEMIVGGKSEVLENPFILIDRKSF